MTTAQHALASSSAIDVMRRLTAGLDGPVEELLAAHAFSVVEMHGTAAGGTASFRSTGTQPWILRAVVPPAPEAARVTLVKQAGDVEVVTLTVVVDGGTVSSLAQAVGLALSVSGFFEQVQGGL